MQQGNKLKQCEKFDDFSNFIPSMERQLPKQDFS